MLEDSNEFAIHRKCRKNYINELYNCEKGGLGGIVGKVTDFVGLTDYKGQAKAQQAAQANASEATNIAKMQLSYAKQISTDQLNYAKQISTDQLNYAKQIATEQLGFSKQQYKDWQSVYGDIQKNLADYYENLSGNTLVSQQLSANAREYATMYKQVNQQLAQKGITNSGISAAVDSALGIQNANTRAQIRASGDQQAITQKAGFLQLGLGQQATLLSGMYGSYGNILSSTGSASNSILSGTGSASNSILSGTGSASAGLTQGYANQANLNQQNYQTLYGSNQQVMSNLMGGFAKSGAMESMGTSVMGGLTSLGAMFSDTRLKRNIQFIGIEDGYNIYSWDWNDLAHTIGASNQPSVGVLAQELLHTNAVSKDITGYYMVDYTKLGVNNG